MNKTAKIIVVIFLIAAVAVVIAVKQNNNNTQTEPSVSGRISVVVDSNQAPQSQSQKLPKLIDLGADKCIPCKMMKPILDELSVEYKGKLDVVFYDVWKNPAYGEKYRIDIIPTQIFLDPNEKELFRHQGFFSKEDILAKWRELGFEIK